MIETGTIDVSTRINFDFNTWRIKQAQANNLVKIKEAADYLLIQMKNAVESEKIIVSEMKKTNRWHKKNEGFHLYKKPEKPSGEGYLTHIYKTNPDNPHQLFFYFDSPIKDEIIQFLIESESIKYIGRKKHQSELHKAWVVQEDEVEKNKRLALREKMKEVLKDTQRKKEIIKSVILLKFNFEGDYSINSLMSNSKFVVLTEGLKDLSITENKKSHIVQDNVNETFITIIKELEKNEIIRINKFGRFFPKTKYKLKVYDEIENELGYEYVIEE